MGGRGTNPHTDGHHGRRHDASEGGVGCSVPGRDGGTRRAVDLVSLHRQVIPRAVLLHVKAYLELRMGFLTLFRL